MSVPPRQAAYSHRPAIFLAKRRDKRASSSEDVSPAAIAFFAEHTAVGAIIDANPSHSQPEALLALAAPAACLRPGPLDARHRLVVVNVTQCLRRLRARIPAQRGAVQKCITRTPGDREIVVVPVVRCVVSFSCVSFSCGCSNLSLFIVATHSVEDFIACPAAR